MTCSWKTILFICEFCTFLKDLFGILQLIKQFKTKNEDTPRSPYYLQKLPKINVMLRNYLYDVIVLCVLIVSPGRCISSLHTSRWSSNSPLDENDAENLESDVIACREQVLRSRPGLFTYISDGTKELCSLYVAAPVDHVVEMEFTVLDVDCDSEGFVGIFDGWELDDEIFPSLTDHPDSPSKRFISSCDRLRLNSGYLTKQNIAQVQFIVPTPGQGFQVKVNFRVNYEPCNMMLLSNHYQKITLRNYGLKRNCTALSLYPQVVQIMYMNIGETSRDRLFLPSKLELGSGIRTTCQSPLGGEDSVQLYEGRGVGSDSWKLVFGVCGVRQTVEPKLIRLRCHSSAVRLQSSGHYFNVVKFVVLPGNGDEDVACQQ